MAKAPEEAEYYVIVQQRVFNSGGGNDTEQTLVFPHREWHNALHAYCGWEGTDSVIGAWLFGSTSKRTYLSYGEAGDPETSLAIWMLTNT